MAFKMPDLGFGKKKDAAPANQSVYLGTNNFYYGPNTSHAYYTPNPWDNSNDSAAAKVGSAVGDAWSTTKDGLVKGGHQTGKLCMKAGKETGSLLASGFQACKKTLGGGST